MPMKKVSTASARTTDRYVRCDDFAQRIDGVHLAPEIWAVFAQLHQARNATELASRLALDIDAVHAALRSLVRRKLVRKHVLAWSDYAASAQANVRNTNIPSAQSASSFSVAPALAPAPLTAIAPVLAVAPASRSPIVSFRVTSPEKPTRPAPSISFRIGPSASAARAVTPAAADTKTAGLRLRPVLDLIGAKAGGGIAGQLLIYRVFLQIPTELMHAAGIHSLNLVDDAFTLHHPALIAALAESARRHAGVDIDALAAT